jgi:hypothetical protein
MYGMINEGLKKMVMERYGQSAWEDMARQACADDVFLRMGQYPDAMTYQLVAAASKILGRGADDILQEFGDYWIDFAYDAYGDLLAVSGNSLIELIDNLNALHTRVGQMMPDLAPPPFMVTDKAENSFILLYCSARQGLAPMIIGLLHGLGRHFQLLVEIEHLGRLPLYPDQEAFHVNYRASQVCTTNE